MDVAALGEEADFGVILFSLIFNILPLVLCGLAMELEKVRIAKINEKTKIAR
jgi:hypothetical protein